MNLNEIEIDRHACIGAGMCYNLAPEVFDLDDEEGKVLLRSDEGTMPSELEPALGEAIALCPVAAIRKAAAK